MWLRVLCVVRVGEKAACAVHTWRVHVCGFGGGGARRLLCLVGAWDWPSCLMSTQAGAVTDVLLLRDSF